MKKLLLVILITTCGFTLNAQELSKTAQIFVRLYNQQHVKIAKGKMLKITDSTLTLKKGSKKITINSAEIDYIKTKRTIVHSILVGAAPGTAIGIGLVAFSEGGYASGIGAITGLALAGVGGAVGLVSSIFKKSLIYSVGDPVKWKVFKESFSIVGN